MSTIPYAKRRIMIPQVLMESEREAFNDVLKQDKSMRTETDQNYPGAAVAGKPDSEQVRRIKRTLKEGEIPYKTEVEKKRLEKRSEQLKAYLQAHMIPKSHIGLRPQKDGMQSMEFQKAKTTMAKEELSAEFSQAAQEYKNIMRILEREDEANLENIRPDTR